MIHTIDTLVTLRSLNMINESQAEFNLLLEKEGELI